MVADLGGALRPLRGAPGPAGRAIIPRSIDYGAMTRSLPGCPSLLAALDRVAEAGSRPVSAQSAAAFRIAFGALALAAVVRFAARGWIDDLYVAPEHHFTYAGLWWVRPWPDWGMQAHFALMGLAAAGVALGYRYRLSVAAFFLLFTYAELLDKTTYLNHYYLVSLLSLLMIFMPLHRAWSLDARRRPPAEGATVPAWVIWTLRAQLGAVYLFAGAAKLNPDWLFHAQPLRIWLSNAAPDAPLIGALLRETWTAYAMSWAGAAFDLAIVGWLLWRRSRLWAYAVLAAFHVLTGLLFPAIGMFPWMMIAFALVFLPPDWPRRLLLSKPVRALLPYSRLLPSFPRRRKSEARKRLHPPLPTRGEDAANAAGEGTADDGAQRAPSPLPIPSWRTRAAAGALALFALAQILIPLRHWAYPGNVRWNEDGYRFSWRVLLTEKHGHVRFRVRATGEERVVLPEEYLTPLQAERMATQPDMILSTARIIARDYERKGAEAEVRADAFVAFNGREAARLIDPDADLARIEPGLWPKRFVLHGPPRAPRAWPRGRRPRRRQAVGQHDRRLPRPARRRGRLPQPGHRCLVRRDERASRDSGNLPLCRHSCVGRNPVGAMAP